MSAPFIDFRDAARAVITSDASLREKEGNFLGGLMFKLEPMTEKQANWLRILLDRHGLPLWLVEAAMGEVVPLRGRRVPKCRGISIFIDAFGDPAVRHPIFGRIGVRQELNFHAVEEARAFAAKLAERHGWLIDDQIDDGGRAA